jgi:hypothetical protein
LEFKFHISDVFDIQDEELAYCLCLASEVASGPLAFRRTILEYRSIFGEVNMAKVVSLVEDSVDFVAKPCQDIGNHSLSQEVDYLNDYEI